MIEGTLIDVATLERHLGDPHWCVIDVRHRLADVDEGERAYVQGHLPGAHFLHCDQDLSGEKTGRNGRHPLPEANMLAARLRACGVSPGVQVVVYDDAEGMIAGRLWWLMRWAGHQAVAVLDGGLPAWLAAGGHLVRDLPAMASGTFVPHAQLSMIATADEVWRRLDDPACRVIDARSPERFRGEGETLDPVGGHIPGAINRFFRDNLDGRGLFKPAESLRAEWLSLLDGQAPETVIHQCGSGVSACHNLLAMERAGLSGSRLYVGSWSEWCADPARPVAR